MSPPESSALAETPSPQEGLGPLFNCRLRCGHGAAVVGWRRLAAFPRANQAAEQNARVAITTFHKFLRFSECCRSLVGPVWAPQRVPNAHAFHEVVDRVCQNHVGDVFDRTTTDVHLGRSFPSSRRGCILYVSAPYSQRPVTAASRLTTSPATYDVCRSPPPAKIDMELGI